MLGLPPECRILDGDLQHLFTIGLLAKNNGPSQDLVALLAIPGFTNNDIILVSGSGHLGPN